MEAGTGLRVHRAERADLLVDGLADLLAVPATDAFASELVIVPAKGVERWLSQRLSHRLGVGGDGADGQDGICAGVEFRSPRSLVAEVLGIGRAADGDDPWAADTLAWTLLHTIDTHLDDPRLGPLAQHLGSGHTGEEAELRRGRRWAVARRLAGLFTSYAEQRPSLLADWEADRDTDGAGRPIDGDLAWQPHLWRALVEAVGEPSPVRRHAEAIARVREDPASVDLPERVSLFGHTRLPVTEVALLQALAARREVHLWLPHPSPALWAALTDEGRGEVVARGDDESYERVGHPLLATLGRDVRELQRVLPTTGHGPDSTPVVSPSRPRTLLGWLQTDIAANRTAGAEELGARRLASGDRSVQVHACHGPARQVEVLREAVLGLMEDDPTGTLQPRDVVVMCPDIETYAPLIEASFGLGAAVAGAHPGQQLQVRLADRALVQTNPLLGVARALLDLAGGRATASAVLDLLHRDPVRRRFRFTDDDLETITEWVRQAGIRWAYDADHREPFGLADFVQNTWRFGLDRVLAGVAMPAEPGSSSVTWVGPTLPLDDVGSTSIDLAGRLAEAVDRLTRITDSLVGTHPAHHWLDTLRDGVEQLTQTGRDEEWQTGQAHRELAGMAAEAAEADHPGGASVELRLPDVRALLGDRLAGRPTRASFRTGSLTVCTMVPMRSVPHRVVCLLGLDEGVYPRSATADGDDVLARRPLTGERDARSEDRQLLLDAILAAKEHLVVLYSGADETTNRPRPPAVPLGELLDALDVTAPGGQRHALVRHPLQDFDPVNFTASRLRVAGPFSFDPQALTGARSFVGPRRTPASLRDDALPPLPADDVDLADLVLFFRGPVRAYLRDRLGVRLAREGEGLLDGLPVEVTGLEEWQVGDRLLADLVRGATLDHACQAEWRRGALPPGRLGWLECRRIAEQALPVAEKFHSFTQGHQARSVDIDVDLGGGRRLRGTVGELYADRRVIATYSRLGPRQLLEAWIPLLALSATYPSRGWTAGALGRGERGRRGEPQEAVGRATFIEQDDAAAHLRDLVAIRDVGLTRPLPLPLRTGYAWAANWREGVEVSARKQAGFAWTSGTFPAEDADPEHVAVWGEKAPLSMLLDDPEPHEQVPGQTTRLGSYAARVWKPLLEARL